MRKFKRIMIFAAAFALLPAALNGCAGSGNEGKGFDASSEIGVVSREDGSGTRGAFIELFGIEQKNDAGKKVDRTTQAAVFTNSTSVMLTTVSGDPYAIGYVSLGLLNGAVKALEIDGVQASAENVRKGSYKIARPFIIVTKGELSCCARDFIDFIMSEDGQTVIEENGYIAVSDAGAYTGSKSSGKLVISGSGSVMPVMEKLKEAYTARNPKVSAELQQSDSSTGISDVIDGICDIGLASRELKASELEKGLSPAVIALDGIAVIVNKENSLDELKSEQVKLIFTGETKVWSEVGGE